MTAEPSNLDDCYALIDRADVHIRAFDHRVRRYLNSSAYGIRRYIDPDSMPPSGESSARKEIVLEAYVRRQPRTQGWGILIGEAVNNLRTALDHAVWRLSKGDTLAPDSVRGTPWGRVGWPVVLREQDWDARIGDSLRFVGAEGRARIRRLQPFQRRKDQPEGDEFAVLDELWNVYKHRQIPVAQFWVGLDEVRSSLRRIRWFSAPLRMAEEMNAQYASHDFEIVSQRAPGPFEHGAELGRVRETGPLYSVFPEFNVNAGLTVEIVFEKGAPAYKGRGVQDTYDRIRSEVVGALDSLKALV